MAWGNWFLALAACRFVTAVPAFEHSADDIQKRQAPQQGLPVAEAAASQTPDIPLVYTYITPSPGATPVPVTRLGQPVTSYIPQYTACLLPPVAQAPQPTPTTWPTTAPYRNYTASWESGYGTCSTIFSETVTEVCRTTLSGLIDRYTIMSCAQNVTFSTQYGYILATPSISPDVTTAASADTPATITSSASPEPSIRTLTSYFIASWQALTTAGPPSDVDLRICSYLTNGTRVCVLEYQAWNTTTVTYIATTTTSINLTTTIANGPSQIIFETITANITERFTTLSLIETAELRYEIERESTASSTRYATGMVTETEPTVYETFTVAPASSNLLPVRTTTVRLTSTVVGGTTTVLLPTTTAGPIETGAAGIDDDGGEDGDDGGKDGDDGGDDSNVDLPKPNPAAVSP